MASPLLLTLCLGMLATCLAVPISNIRWCVKSEQELKKCKDLSGPCRSDEVTLSCVLKSSTDDCIKAIADGVADAITLDSGEIFQASLHPYDLKPIIAENYGTEKEPDTCYYAVALVKKSSTFQFKDLNGTKSCHTAVGRMAGWKIPIGLLVEFGKISLKDTDNIEKAVAGFFAASCAPGAKEEKLCKLCAGTKDNKCKASEAEPYFGYSGARRCLKEDKGQIAFVKHFIPDNYKEDYELLCIDNTRKAIGEHETCSWARVPSHAVVSKNNEDKIKAITDFLVQAQSKAECKLFESSHGKDLMFKDSAKFLIPIPSKVDAALYLGRSLMGPIKALQIETQQKEEREKIRWCCQSKEETSKCDTWTVESGGAIECVEASNAEDCISKILKGDADAVALDGGYLYTAGACGLVPAMGEIYNAEDCKGTGTISGSYYAVAIIKASDKNISWKNLKDKKSCHTGVGRTAGWIIPAGFVKKETGICDLTQYFKESCAPGADPDSKLCSLCIGEPQKSLDNTKCSANNRESYYGYHGAIRCLVEKGEVAFVKDQTVFEVTKDAPGWLKNKKPEDFLLLCRDGTTRPVTDYKECHLAHVPSHAVATTPGKREMVTRVLKEQERQFGRKEGKSDQSFCMFTSAGPRDLLFKDTTQCLRVIPATNMNDYLGEKYVEAVSSLSTCTQSELLKACNFHTCKF